MGILSRLKNATVRQSLKNGEIIATTDASTENNSKQSQNGLLTNYRISAETITNLNKRGINSLFLIQQRTFDYIYDGYDVVGRARTGTGKTLAFALPVVERLIQMNYFPLDKRGRKPSVLCLVPTRELAQQVNAEFDIICSNRYVTVCIYGGTPDGPQIEMLRQGADIIVATPGRTIDMLNRNFLKLNEVQVTILDEADQMLEMGFREDVDFILDRMKEIKTGKNDIQYLLFSATLPSWIYSIARRFMKPNKIIVDIVKNEFVKAATGIRHLVMKCSFTVRLAVLSQVLNIYCQPKGRCIIFAETKLLVNQIATDTHIAHISQALHGDIPQIQREATLKRFKDGRFRCLIATDIAARGLHIDNVDLVIQISPPKDSDTYLHRSGRTARAGNSGICLTFYRDDDTCFLRQLQKACGFKFERVGVPQQEQIIDVVTNNISKTISQTEISTEILANLGNIAERLMNEFGAIDVISKFVYVHLGLENSKMNIFANKSAISGREHFKTYQINFFKKKIEKRADIWKSLKYQFPNQIKIIDKITSIILLADYSGAVFDVPYDVIQSFNKLINIRNNVFELHAVSVLPPLYDGNFEDNDDNDDENFKSLSGNLRNPNHVWTSKVNERQEDKNKKKVFGNRNASRNTKKGISSRKRNFSFDTNGFKKTNVNMNKLKNETRRFKVNSGRISRK